jgi:hypothetical protein
VRHHRNPRKGAPRDHAAWHAYIVSVLGRRFRWGSHDCVRYGFKAARALTGRDLAAELGVTWSNEATARQVIAGLGGIAKGMDRILPRTPCALAHRGDLGLVEDPAGHGQTLVVIEGELVSAPGRTGLQRWPRRALLLAWSLS